MLRDLCNIKLSVEGQHIAESYLSEINFYLALMLFKLVTHCISLHRVPTVFS